MQGFCAGWNNSWRVAIPWRSVRLQLNSYIISYWNCVGHPNTGEQEQVIGSRQHFASWTCLVYMDSCSVGSHSILPHSCTDQRPNRWKKMCGCLCVYHSLPAIGDGLQKGGWGMLKGKLRFWALLSRRGLSYSLYSLYSHACSFLLHILYCSIQFIFDNANEMARYMSLKSCYAICFV